MIYLFLLASVALNIMLAWYVRKMLAKYWYDVDARTEFTKMLVQYSESLQSLYKLEELYGEEIIKKAITQTNFVIEACNEFRETIDNENPIRDEEESPEEDEEQEASDGTRGPIILKEGQKVSQSAATYRRVVSTR